MSDFFTPKLALNDFFYENGELVNYPVGHFVIHQKDEYGYMSLVIKGAIRATCSFDEDLERTVAYIIPNTIIGQPGANYGFKDGRLNFVAETPITVRRVKKELFMKRIKENAHFTSDYVDVLQRNQIVLLNRVAALSAKGVDAQCAHLLNFMRLYYGVRKGNTCEIVVPLTQTSIAEMIFATRESVNSSIKNLIVEKIIKSEKKKITILNIKKLEQLSKRL